MAVPVQAGTDVVIGFGALIWAAVIAEDGLTWKPGMYDNTEVIKDQDGATRTKIRMDKRAELAGSFIIDDTSGSVTIASAGIDEGDVIEITDPAGTAEGYEVMDVSFALAAGAAKMTITLVKEVSMDYSPA